MTQRQQFIDFIHRREAMRVHKEFVGGAGPHSDDPILAHHSFCNINREHDAVTVFIHQNFRVPFYNRGRTFMVRQMLLCRIFNEPDVLRQVCPLVDSQEAVDILKAYRDADHKLMRGAYMMPPHGKTAGDVDIVDHWILEVIDPVCKFDYTYKTSLKQVAECLMTVCGIGPFIANQVCTDLRYVPIWGISYTDWSEFILCGPGTRRGMNRYFGRDLLATGSDQKFAAELLEIRDDLSLDVSHTIRQYYVDPNNLSNSFCEFDKYQRGCQQLAEGKEVTLRRYKAKEDKQLEMFN